ncbi:MAG: sulfotransferase [Bacteroidota bacterium]
MRRIKLARFLMMISRRLPSRLPVRSVNNIQKPIFVFGSGRNGSSLLNRMLNQHPLLFAPTEQYFLGPTIIKFYLYRHLINWRDLVKIIAGELDESSGSHTWETGFGPHLAGLFESEDKSLQFLIDEIYRTYGKSQKTGFKYWADTCSSNTRYYKEIFRCFPDAHYLFLIRDGRDVVNSFMKGGETLFGELSNPKRAASNWVDSVKAYSWLKGRTDISLIRYEELVRSSETILKGICNRIEIEYYKEMPDFYLNDLPKGMTAENHQNLKRPVFTESIGLWKNELDPRLIEEIQPVIASFLKKFNYQ